MKRGSSGSGSGSAASTPPCAARASPSAMAGIRSRSASRICPIQPRSSFSGCTPENDVTGCCATTTYTVGIDCTWNIWAMRGFASTSTLARIQDPPLSLASFSSVGESCLHG